MRSDKAGRMWAQTNRQKTENLLRPGLPEFPSLPSSAAVTETKQHITSSDFCEATEIFASV